ncbi:NYN domain-containing protein [Rhizobiales bacterium RZME27]|uniref:NYN domain-containing protein n=1 Tax=Endobacterium cereale TaxID=2663029 RepID=A0A6A8A6N8_9HYPH|nr:NYN domain-containing protein [Endobacterium cereale]MEB2843602.1 NYN domain-containing protein [Endobacterium cereale]MQY45528.1 NYN domain-containing protein [Endobacterium cereale]
MHEIRPRRLAVLIDAENASAKIVDGLFKEIAKLGDATVRRIYGDFSAGQCRPWVDVLARHSINPQQVFAYTTGKNACDIALAIDAMDILHRGGIDGFCLVSSDSDFTRLAMRIREQGLDVFGFGEMKTPESFRLACQRFIYTEGLQPPAVIKEVKTAPTPASPQLPSAATPLIVQAFAQLGSKDGWVPLSELGKKLTNLDRAFNPRTYGAENLRELVRKTKAFEINIAKKGIQRIRFKVVTAEKKKAA